MTRDTQSVGRHALTTDEIDAVLIEVGWGVLAVGEELGPYAVPIAYGFDGRDVYIGTGPGRKLRGLERNPRVCLTVTDPLRAEGWRSVVMIGRVRWLDGPAARVRAIGALTAQRRAKPLDRLPLTVQVKHLFRGRLAQIEVEELTGRRG